MTSETDDETDGRTPHFIGGELAFQSKTTWLLAGAGKLVLRRWDRMLADRGLTSSQYKVVLALAEAAPLGQQRLGGLVGIDPRNLVPVIEALVKRGVLSREVDPADRRRRVLQLTAGGVDVAEELVRATAAIEAQILSPLGSDEVRGLDAALHALLEPGWES